MTMNCLVHVWLHAADYFLSLHNYFSFIIVLFCVALNYQFIITCFTQYRHKSTYLFAVKSDRIQFPIVLQSTDA